MSGNDPERRAKEGVDLQRWREMAAEAQDALIESGWHPGPAETEDEFVAFDREFMTTRQELFERLVLGVPADYVVTEGTHGKGRRYHMAIGDFIDVFWRFCDEKEAGVSV